MKSKDGGGLDSNWNEMVSGGGLLDACIVYKEGEIKLYTNTNSALKQRIGPVNPGSMNGY